MPRQVYLWPGDNRLLLDLDGSGTGSSCCVPTLRRAGGDLVLQEGLPGAADAWLPGPGWTLRQ